MKLFRLPILACLVWISSAALWAEEKPVAIDQPLAVVRVNATTQAPDFFRPWAKKPAVSRRALGAVLPGNRVLIAAELVANQSYIELEKAASGEKVAATLTAVDYETNLALVTPVDPKFLANLSPLQPASQVKTGDRLDIWQLETNGTLIATSGLVTACEVGRYPLEDYGYLIFRITATLQYRENSFSVPIVKEGKLAGLLMRFDSRSQTVDAISLPVIEHFLKAAGEKPYRGFPRAGIQFQPTRDPQFRRYLKLPEGNGGIYLSRVESGAAAAAAGFQAGDTVLAIDGKHVDADGNYDHPVYGKIFINHLISTEHYAGEAIRVKFSRAGEIRETTLTAADRPPQSYVIEPYVIDRQPKFILLGGLLFQEMSRQFLREWGGNWYKDGPLRFIYLDRYQTEIFPPERGKIVFLSQVFPTPSAIGYDQLAYLIVEKVNGQTIKGIADLDAALKTPLNGFHKIEFNDDPRTIYLDATTVGKDTADVQQQYGFPMTSWLTE